MGGASRVHTVETRNGQLIGKQTLIGKDAFLGTYAVALAGTKVEDGGIISAYSTVQDTVRSDEMVVGDIKSARASSALQTNPQYGAKVFLQEAGYFLCAVLYGTSLMGYVWLIDWFCLAAGFGYAVNK